ncbi:actin nucleation-promoting factor WAS-like [Melospiza melodia melodia]|uniref:actin nucleation-promoting factor WAS-like n=1 Tax=Melospiza melodia melodia TaxID=1914991 RepID=UPI002FD0BF22
MWGSVSAARGSRWGGGDTAGRYRRGSFGTGLRENRTGHWERGWNSPRVWALGRCTGRGAGESPVAGNGGGGGGGQAMEPGCAGGSGGRARRLTEVSKGERSAPAAAGPKPPQPTLPAPRCLPPGPLTAPYRPGLPLSSAATPHLAGGGAGPAQAAWGGGRLGMARPLRRTGPGPSAPIR